MVQLEDPVFWSRFAETDSTKSGLVYQGFRCIAALGTLGRLSFGAKVHLQKLLLSTQRYYISYCFFSECVDQKNALLRSS